MEHNAIFITGANGGMGSALVPRLLNTGWTVYAGVRSNSSALPDHPHLRTVRLDVTDPSSIADAVATVASARGDAGLQALVNLVGVPVLAPAELQPEAELRLAFEVNFFGPASVMRQSVPLLRAGQGRIINVTGIAARLAVPLYGAIASSKVALSFLSDAARVELAGWGIPVVLVEPGLMETPALEKADQAMERFRASAPDERRALYDGMLDAIGAAGARQRPNPVDVAVDVIMRAVEDPRPKARYLGGRDARMLAMLARVPVRLRDRLVARALRLPKPQARVPTAV